MSLVGQKIGRYLLQSQLGSGGMGEVYLATDTQINRQVAIKVIRSGTTTYPNVEATKEATRLFYREMRAIAVLDHPHILPLYDFGEEGIITYMVRVAVPANAQDGQLIRIPAQRDSSGGSTTGPLTIMLAVTRTEKLKPPLVPERVEEKTYLSPPRQLEERPIISNSTVSKEVARSHWRLSKRRVALLLGLAILIIIGSFGVFLLVRNAVLPNPYPPHTGTLLLDDSLSDNGLTWFQGSDSHGSCAFTSGAYHVSESTPGFQLCTNGAMNFSNFAYQVQMTITSGDSGGITFRTDAATLKCYFFRIGQDGSYELGSYGDQQPTLKNGTSSAINTGLNQSNLIAVVANGSSIDLYVNLHYIASVSDSTYTSGQVGVAAYSANGTTEVAFNNAMVWGL